MADKKKRSMEELLELQVELQLKREEREARREEKEMAEMLAKEIEYNRKRANRIRSETDEAEKIFAKQATCDHRKGTTGKVPTRIVDYHLSVFTFVGNKVRIRCNKCGFKWYQFDRSQDYIIRDKQKLPNPTKMTFNDAFKLTIRGNTSNQPARSETWITPPKVDESSDEQLMGTVTQ